MRTIVVLSLILVTVGAVGCSSTAGTLGAKTGGDAASDGGPFCPQTVGDCSSLPAGAPAMGDYCTFPSGFASACMLCGGDGGCAVVAGIVYGATHTYISIFGVDTGTVLAYDKAGALVAVLLVGPTVTCAAGPSDFDPTEALATAFSASSQQALQQMCDVASSDGGADAQSGRD